MTPGTLTRHRVERVFREHGLWERLNVIMETTNYALVIEYVTLGLGISVIAGNPDEKSLHGLYVRQVAKWFGEETIALVWKKGTYQLEHARGFRELVRQALVPNQER